MRKQQMEGSKPDGQKPPRWHLFKGLSERLENRRENLINEAMEQGNAAKVLRLINKVSDDSGKRAAKWLEERGNFDHKTAKTLYKRAVGHGDFYIPLFVNAFSKVCDKEKKGLWKTLSRDVENVLQALLHRDSVEENAANLIMLHVKVGKDNLLNYDSTVKTLKELVFEGKTRDIKTRLFAVDMLLENGFGDAEFLNSVFRSKNDNELKVGTLELLYDCEFIGDALIEGNTDERKMVLDWMLAGTPDSYGFDEKICRGLVECIKNKKNTQNEKITSQYAKNVFSRHKHLGEFLERMLGERTYPEEIAAVISAIFDRMNLSGIKTIERTNLINCIVSLLASKNKKRRELTKMGIKKVVEEDDERAKKITRNIIKYASLMLDMADIKQNVKAAEALISLSFLPEARKVIRDRVVIEFNELANDKNLGEEQRKIALVTLKKLSCTNNNARQVVPPMIDES